MGTVNKESRPYQDHPAQIMGDGLETHVNPGTGRILDVGYGLGTITAALKQHFPRLNATACDRDPVPLYIAREPYHPLEDVRWLDKDLRTTPEGDNLELGYVAIVTASALPWPDPGLVAHLYQDFSALLKSRGLFFNSDHRRQSIPQDTAPLFDHAGHTVQSAIHHSNGTIKLAEMATQGRN